MTCLTCRHRYTSDAFGPRVSLCGVYNAATEIDPSTVRDHLFAEWRRLGRLPTFDEVENCPAHAPRPRLIALEGPDGVGKTTLALRLADHLRAKGRRVLLTAEPTRGPIGTLIRAAMAGDATLQPALAHLFAADRALHLATEIGPALADGLDVICDRYTLSSLVYQGAVAGPLNEHFRVPDLTLLLSAPVSVRLARLSARAVADPWEQERAEALGQCYAVAAADVETRGWTVARIDASGTPDDTFEAALRALWEPPCPRKIASSERSASPRRPSKPLRPSLRRRVARCPTTSTPQDPASARVSPSASIAAARLGRCRSSRRPERRSLPRLPCQGTTSASSSYSTCREARGGW